MSTTTVKLWPLLVFVAAALCSCASISEQVGLWSRSDQIEAGQASSMRVGLEVEDEAYQESLKRWPNISDSGLQRRALIYSLLTAQGRSLDSWATLNAQENLNLELAQIARLRRRSAF